MDRLNIGENIVRLRHNRKITQEQLAEFAGVTKASVSKWETGQSTPDIMILPRLAAFFDVTVDELIGYTPQLSREQIQKLHQRFKTEFSERPFEEVMTEIQTYVRRYYSCYPFLFQISILWLNYYGMADGKERQEEILNDIVRLCQRIKEGCKDIRMQQNAVVIQAGVHLQLGKIREVVEELEGIFDAKLFVAQSSGILAQAYMMLGKTEKADEFIQVNMYENLFSILGNSISYLAVHINELPVCEETINRVEQVAEAYKIIKLNPNNLASFEYQAASCYLLHGEKQKALIHAKKYVSCVFSLFSEADIHLHGDAYFDKIEGWFSKELDNGTSAPRGRKTVLEDVWKSLDAPQFAALEGDSEFEKLKIKLKELR